MSQNSRGFSVYLVDQVRSTSSDDRVNTKRVETYFARC